MNLTLYKNETRGAAEMGWLHAKYSFSFANYHNPERMSFGTLCVLNEDVIDPAQGFGSHPHADMEIVTIILEGALEHKDSMGNQGVIRTGEVQRMSAGTGVVHSEFNASKTEPVHVLQVWVHTQKEGIVPSYEQKAFPAEERKNQLLPVVSTDTENALHIYQNAAFYLGSLDAGVSTSHKLKNPKHGVYVFMISGQVQIGDETLNQGDAAGITDSRLIELTALQRAEVLLIEVPML